MSDPTIQLKRELLAAAERQQEYTILTRTSRRRRHTVAFAAALVVAAVAAATVGAVRFLDKGFIGLPPVGATPSAPESGELVVHWEGAHPQVGVWVYADGRMIWFRQGSVPGGANELTSGYLEQRLTLHGVELVRSAVAELFDRSRALGETVPAEASTRPGYPSPGGLAFGSPDGLALGLPQDSGSGLGSVFGAVDAPDGDRLRRIHWRVSDTTATPEQVSALLRVAALLTDPLSVLPSSAWAVREVRAYVPSHYAVCIQTSPPEDASRLLSLLPARAADVLRDKSRTRSEGDVVEAREGYTVVLGQRVTYCSTLTTKEARVVADALSGLEPDSGVHHRLGYLVAEGVSPTWDATTIWFEPYFPHGQFADSRPAG